MGDFYAVNDNRMEGGARRLLREVLVPQAEKLDGGDIAVVVFEPGNACQRAARAAGWDGKSSVFSMPRPFRERLIENADTVTATWLAGRRPGVVRMFVFLQEGTLLINWSPGTGYYIEPGSLDSERPAPPTTRTRAETLLEAIARCAARKGSCGSPVRGGGTAMTTTSFLAATLWNVFRSSRLATTAVAPATGVPFLERAATS